MTFARPFTLVAVALALGCAAKPSPAPAVPEPEARVAQPQANPASPPISAERLCGPDIAGSSELTQPLVLVGEIHGTQEIPTAFGRLVCRAAVRNGQAPVLVGLELPRKAQAQLDAYLDSSGDAAAKAAFLSTEFWTREFQDGRSSEAMVALIEQLRRVRAAGPALRVVAIDDDEAKTDVARDAAMAERLRVTMERVGPVQTWVFAGNLHTRALPGYPWEPEAPFESVAVHLRRAVPSLVTLNVALLGGQAWNCRSAEAKDCGPGELKGKQLDGVMPRIELEPDAIERSGYSGKLVLGTVTASNPAVAPK